MQYNVMENINERPHVGGASNNSLCAVRSRKGASSQKGCVWSMLEWQFNKAGET